VHTGFLWGDLRESGNLEDLEADRIVLKWILKK